MSKAHRATSILKIAFTVSSTLVAISATAAPTSATPRIQGGSRDPGVLQEKVVRLFDRLDLVGRVVEDVRTRMASIEDRISDLSRQIDARQELLNRRAAEAYMAGRAGGVESLLGASSFTALGDALEYLDAVSEEDRDLILSLHERRAELQLEQHRLEALAEELRRKRQWLDATASDLVEELRRQQASLGREERATADAEVGGSPDPAPVPVPTATLPVPGPAAVTSLIRDRFTSLGAETTRIALCVAEAESGFDPSAVNPATGAAGVFQFLPSTWESLSDLAGWGAASVLDPRANVAVAAWTVAHYGWHPWRSVAGGCGA